MFNEFDLLSNDENLITNSVISLDQGVADSSYPISNLKTLPVSPLAFRTVNKAIAITFKFSELKRHSIVAFVDHNLTQNAVITVTNPGGYMVGKPGYNQVAFAYSEQVIESNQVSVYIADPTNNASRLNLGYAVIGEPTKIGYLQDNYPRERYALEDRIDNSVGVPLLGNVVGDVTILQCSFINDGDFNESENILKKLNSGRVYAFVRPEGIGTTDPIFGRLQPSRSILKRPGTFEINSVVFETDAISLVVD